jgi:hypothetical protein
LGSGDEYPDFLESFLRRFPNGRYAEEARSKIGGVRAHTIRLIAKSKASSSPGRRGRRCPRHRRGDRGLTADMPCSAHPSTGEKMPGFDLSSIPSMLEGIVAAVRWISGHLLELPHEAPRGKSSPIRMTHRISIPRVAPGSYSQGPVSRPVLPMRPMGGIGSRRLHRRKLGGVFVVLEPKLALEQLAVRCVGNRCHPFTKTRPYSCWSPPQPRRRSGLCW